MDKLGLFASVLGHIGDGNFHASIMYDRSNPEELEKVEKCVHDMVRRALEMEGSCTVSVAIADRTLMHHRPTAGNKTRVLTWDNHLQGEHGVGMGKKEFLREELGPDTIGVMRSIKKSLDPHWLLNPGKIFDREEPSRDGAQHS